MRELAWVAASTQLGTWKNGVVRVLVAMSGGVDSSLAAALLVEQGHDVAGATMKLWGGPSDTGCCSVADVHDARRVADSLGIDHAVFDLTEDFEASVVAPYVAAHAAGRTPNPCAECNRHLKFSRFLDRALRLGFDAVATGHHARLRPGGARGMRLFRGKDPLKDQSYVLSMLTSEVLAKVLLPIGELTKAEVRAGAADRGLRTAGKPESQDVCFVGAGPRGAGRLAFLGERIALHPGRVVDSASGKELSSVAAIELVTVGQRRGLEAAAGGERRYALHVDVPGRMVLVGSAEDLANSSLGLESRTWVVGEVSVGTKVAVQTSAHGVPRPAVLVPDGVRFLAPERRCAPGQLVALYAGEEVMGSGVAC